MAYLRFVNGLGHLFILSQDTDVLTTSLFIPTVYVNF